MSRTVISVENLSKRYLIGHETNQRGGDTMLRDIIGREARNFVRKAVDLFRGRQIIQGDEVEEFWALRDVSFEVKQGEVLGIIGRNGAGKSTLLKILSRITEPTEGLVRLRGRLGCLLEVGTGFHPELTGRENVFLNGAILGMTQRDIRTKFDEIVAFADIDKFVDTPVKRYSSGMYVRLAFAVAAHLEPEILAVDEVLAVGDATFQKKCLGKMEDVARGGRTILFVSHNMGAIGTLCQRTAYIENGQLRAIGATREILPMYLSSGFGNQAESLDRLRLPGYGKRVRFSRIKLLGRDGANLRFGDPLAYALNVRADARVNEVSIGSSIFDRAGSCVGTLCTKETFSIGADEELNLRLEIRDLNLAPGIYYAGFSIGHGSFRDSLRHDLDVVIGAPLFQIMPTAREDNMVANWHPNWGSIVIFHAQLIVEGQGPCAQVTIS
jgi:homopolymeric O-antigen transport system ATP-binding protein